MTRRGGRFRWPKDWKGGRGRLGEMKDEIGLFFSWCSPNLGRRDRGRDSGTIDSAQVPSLPSAPLPPGNGLFAQCRDPWRSGVDPDLKQAWENQGLQSACRNTVAC